MLPRCWPHGPQAGARRKLVAPSQQRIFNLLSEHLHHMLIAFNKPFNVLCQFTERQSVFKDGQLHDMRCFARIRTLLKLA